jgi:hypothetical protein
MIRTVKDMSDAVDAGRVHTQRFFKNAGTTGDRQWHDWSYASGQPAYDARVGSPATFTPFVAQGNDAIYFPPAPGTDRRLLSCDVVRTAGAVNQIAAEFQVYDLIGVYPLIDGDSTDEQVMDNTAAFPRFASGEGVRAVLVNHIAPGLAAADALVEYVNTQGATKSVTWRATASGQNKVCYTVSGSGTTGPLFCNLAAGDTGISRINALTFTTSPGGLWAIYIVKPVAYFSARDGLPGLWVSATCETNFALERGWSLPKIEDGAWLGLFFMPEGNTRTIALHGNMTFIWG